MATGKTGRVVPDATAMAGRDRVVDGARRCTGRQKQQDESQKRFHAIGVPDGFPDD